MDFLELSKKRFTAKRFDSNKTISDADIKTLKEIIRLTPSSVNSQPWHFIFGSSDKAKAKVRPAIADFNWDRIDTCSHFVIIAVENGISAQHLNKLIESEKADGRLPTEQIAKDAAERRKYYVELKEANDNVLDWERRQAYIALATILYGAASLGIDSTPIEGFSPEAMDKILGLDQHNLKSVLVVTLGYDAADDHNATRPKSRLTDKQIFWDME